MTSPTGNRLEVFLTLLGAACILELKNVWLLITEETKAATN